METSTNVINTVAASAGDVSLAARQLSITGAPTINYLGIAGIPVVQRSLSETAAVKTLTIVAANNTEYSFVASQVINDNVNSSPKRQVITYTSDASATSAEISNALIALFNLHGFEITLAATSGTVTTFTANAGYPLFTLTNISNCTIADAVPVVAPSGTANLAITSVIAPHGTAATAIAGTSTVTVTTLADHGLMVGDQVTIGDVATMVLTPGTTGGTFYVASVPTATTFTLADVTAAGANSGTITISTVNTVIVNVLTANTLEAGETVTIASIATMTVNGAASFTGRVRNAASTTQYYIDGVTNNGSLNSGTITITPVAQAAVNTYDALVDSVADVTAGSKYTSWTFDYASALPAFASFQDRSAAKQQVVYVAEGANTGNYPAFYTRLNELINGYLPFSTDFNAETVSL